MDCKDVTQRLDEYLEGGPDAQTRRRIAAHLDSCAACAAELAARKAYGTALDSLVEVSPPADFLEQVRARTAPGYRAKRMPASFFSPARTRTVLKLAATAATLMMVFALVRLYEPLRQTGRAPKTADIKIARDGLIEEERKSPAPLRRESSNRAQKARPGDPAEDRKSKARDRGPFPAASSLRKAQGPRETAKRQAAPGARYLVGAKTLEDTRADADSLDRLSGGPADKAADKGAAAENLPAKPSPKALGRVAASSEPAAEARPPALKEEAFSEKEQSLSDTVADEKLRTEMAEADDSAPIRVALLLKNRPRRAVPAKKDKKKNARAAAAQPRSPDLQSRITGIAKALQGRTAYDRTANALTVEIPARRYRAFLKELQALGGLNPPPPAAVDTGRPVRIVIELPARETSGAL